MNKLVAALPKAVFSCLVVGPCRSRGRDSGLKKDEDGLPSATLNADGDVEGAEEELEHMVDFEEDSMELNAIDISSDLTGSSGPKGTMYDALVLQLGSFFRYSLYSPSSVPPRKQGKIAVESNYIMQIA